MILNKILGLFLIGFFVFPPPSRASDSSRYLVILYGGDTKGYVEGCG